MTSKLRPSILYRSRISMTSSQTSTVAALSCLVTLSITLSPPL